MYEKLKRDGDYLLVFRHDISNGAVFTSKAEARSTGFDPDIEDKFSVLNSLEKFRREDGCFQFKLHYPNENITNIWKQSNNFAAYDSPNILTRGNLANGQDVVELQSKSGEWNIIEKENPGSSKYVLEQSTPILSDRYQMSLSNTRLKPNTTYTMSCWIAAENEEDYDKALFKYQLNTDDGNIQNDSSEYGAVFEAPGNDIIVDGVRWIRKYYRFTTPNTIATTKTFVWLLGWSSVDVHIPTGKRWIANIQITDAPLIDNYAGDYDATEGGVRDYQPISIEAPGTSSLGLFAGLEYSLGTANGTALADGVIGTKWWYAIGSSVVYNGGMPGPVTTSTIITKCVELWVYAPIGVEIGKHTIWAKHFTESRSNDQQLFIRGVADGSDHVSDVQLNGVSQYLTEAKTNSKVNLVIFDGTTGEMSYTNDYILSTTAERNNFIAKLNEITDEFFVIASNGSMIGNADVDTAINQFNPISYLGNEYYSKYSYSYAAFGSGELGIIHDDSCFDSTLDGDSEISVAFHNKDTLANTGYGKPIIEEQNPGSGEIAALFDDITPGQHLLYKVRATVDAVYNIVCNLRIYDQAGVEIARQNVSFSSIGIPDIQEFYVEVPEDAYRIAVWVADTVGDFIDYIIVTKAGFDIETGHDTIRTSVNGLSCGDLRNSMCNAYPAYINGECDWLKSYFSDSNLYYGKSMPESESGDVIWGKETVPNSDKTITLSTGTTPELSMETVSIDNTRPYYVSMWVKTLDKDTGYLDLTARVSNGDSTTGLIDVNGNETSLSILIDRVDNPSEYLDKWILLQGFILPHDTTDEEHQEFIDTYAHYFGVHNPDDVPDRLQSKGVGIYSSTAPKVLRWKDDSTQFSLSFVDDGSTTSSTTHWALPMLTETKSASFYMNTMYGMQMIF